MLYTKFSHEFKNEWKWCVQNNIVVPFLLIQERSLIGILQTKCYIQFLYLFVIYSFYTASSPLSSQSAISFIPKECHLNKKLLNNEGYDLPNPKYKDWLAIYHAPKAYASSVVADSL